MRWFLKRAPSGKLKFRKVQFEMKKRVFAVVRFEINLDNVDEEPHEKEGDGDGDGIPHICHFFSTGTIFSSIFLHAKARKSYQN